MKYGCKLHAARCTQYLLKAVSQKPKANTAVFHSHIRTFAFCITLKPAYYYYPPSHTFLNSAVCIGIFPGTVPARFHQ
jgi:hypothetical protein